ncbi:hypothetical protein PMAYCL1PPCAC_22256, partial [Pristionchus mayeri]
IHDVLHTFDVTYGISINIIAIMIIMFKTPAALKEYSHILLNTSIIELFSFLAHFIVNGRLFIDYPAVFCISEGPCRLVSHEFCSIMAGFMNINMIYSMSMVCLSFWYRRRIVEKRGLLGRVRLQLLICLLFLPHTLHITVFFFVKSPSVTLEPVVQRFYKASHN